MLKIKPFDIKYRKKVTEYLMKNKEASPFHRFNWSQIIADNYNHNNVSLISLDNDKVCGVLPLSQVRLPLSSNYLATAPYSSHSEILGDSENIKNELVKGAIQLSHKLKSKYIEFKNINILNEENSRKLIGDEASDKLRINDQYCTMVLNCENEKETWENLSKTLRNEIRNSFKNNLTISTSSDKFDEFYELISITMKRHGTPVHSRKFYKDLIEKMENTFLISVILDDKVIATNLLLGFNKTLHSLASASDSNYWSYKPNQLLWWECIKFAIENNYQFLDFGRSIKDQGTYHFKRKFGAKPVNLNYLYYLNKVKDFPNFSNENFTLNVATNIWKKLPLKFTQITGHYFIRNIS